jgi:hypothetical protein
LDGGQQKSNQDADDGDDDEQLDKRKATDSAQAHGRSSRGIKK